jgi:hypothetical protein
MPAGVWFTLRVPDSWYEFAPWRAAHTGDLARLVDARIGTAPWLAPHRQTLLRLLHEAGEQARQQGALLCAVLADQVGTESLLATLTVLRTPGQLDAALNTAEAIAAQLPGARVVDLPAGRAARLDGLQPLAGADGPVEYAVSQTFVPLPDGSGVLDIVLTSPQAELADDWFEVSDAVARTLTWVDVEVPPPPTGSLPPGSPLE